MASQWTTTLTEVLLSLPEDQAKQFSHFFLLFIASARLACKLLMKMDR